ncbi:uncharacterized protein LTR77_006326 [Saxophila tyrrhenica]|uniref:Mtf2-like C-terminal domain-containing protein n=1 Tax=Saxophila tyrrhenica TaxID=1690608 RepID=A0AAV9P867_9PEZI|nr:hypothetical protein LTR77_006326 [Saxophila tyrrhenica]
MNNQRRLQVVQRIDQSVQAQRAVKAESNKVRQIMESAASDLEVCKEEAVDEGNVDYGTSVSDGGEFVVPDTGVADAFSVPAESPTGGHTLPTAPAATKGQTPSMNVSAAQARKLLSNHIVDTQRTIATKFPSSPLSLSVLPTIRALGAAPAAFVLSARHWNGHLKFHFLQYQDVGAMLALLQQMEEEFIEFDTTTLNRLLYALTFGKRAREGRMGQVAQKIWTSEARKKDLEQLQERTDRLIAGLESRDTGENANRGPRIRLQARVNPENKSTRASKRLLAEEETRTSD